MSHRIFLPVLAQCAVLLVAAAPAHAELRVVTTTTDLGWIAHALGGDRVRVDTICKGDQDPHFLQPKPSYMVMLNRADLLVAVGLELEVGWLPALVQGARNPDINPGRPGYLEAGTAITPMDVPKGGVDRSHGDIHPFGNPHFWLDPLNVKLVARTMTDRLARLDAEGAQTYRANLAALDARIDRGMKRWQAAMAPLRGTKIASYHATYNYFHHRFGLDPIGYLEDRPGIPPAPAHLVDLIRQMRADGVRVIFHESFYDRSASTLVAGRSGARVLVLPTSVGGAPRIDTYEQLMDHIVNNLVQALAAAPTGLQTQAKP